MRLCSATTKSTGEPCQRPAQGSGEFCIGHDPNKAAERQRMASRGGRGKVNTETKAIKKLMNDLTEKVLAGEVEPAVSHAVVALQNIKLRAIETERKIKETQELEARLEALELQEQHNGHERSYDRARFGSPWARKGR